ncbi:MAG TPA: hypothetical protein VE444_07495 [Gaiellaceae bacterium]|nr:hypothetical protein [Gaiellaceae bacterium]
MLLIHPCDALTRFHVHERRLRAEAAAEHLRTASSTRSTLAASLRRIADHLDPTPLAVAR